jgi:hypothetical protein
MESIKKRNRVKPSISNRTARRESNKYSHQIKASPPAFQFHWSQMESEGICALFTVQSLNTGLQRHRHQRCPVNQMV